MSRKIRILILEDVPADAELVERELRKTEKNFVSKWVATREDFIKELKDFAPELVLSDYSLPQFTGMEALKLVKELAPSIPVVMVTGSINEETAVGCMKAGAEDYVLKDHLVRIGSAVKAALKNKRVREEKKQAEERLAHLNIVLLAIRSVNQLIVHEKNRDLLLTNICEILVDIRGYSKAWVSLWDQSGNFLTAAEAGFGEQFHSMLEWLKVGKQPPCIMEALKQPGIALKQNPVEDCAGCPLAQSEAAGSAMVVPLAHEDKVYGVLNVRILTGMYMDEAEQSLFQEVGEDIGYALYSIEAENERKQAEEALRKSRDKLHKAQLQHQAVLRSTPHGLCMLTSNWIITWANSAMIKMLELKPDKTRYLRTPFKTLFANEKNFNDYQKSALHSVRTTGIDVRELELRWPDGKPLWCEISIVRIDPHETEPGLVATFSDITERKQAEEERKQSLEKIRTTLEETVNALASAVEMRDPYTAGHQRRVAQLACAVAKEMDMSDEQIEAVHMAGLIHDIGKISVPAEILSKPSRLSEMEMDLIKIHPQVSFDILKDIEFPWPIAHIVLQHHERMDGSGYPHGLSGEDILLEARILAVADVVEAMASHRPYRPALGTDKALDEISKNKGLLYDAAVVNACAKLLAEEGFDLDKIRVTKERRKWPRVNVELPCEVQLLMPDETFQPRRAHGCIMNLSMRGARVRISSLLKDVFQKLLRPNRYVKLIFSTPESERKLKVIGKIVSMEFKEKEQLLDLRAYFENVEPKVQTVLERIVEQGS